MSDNKKGLFGKYRIQKSNGEPVDDDAEYFVLRHDSFGDHCHVEASRKALKAYADAIRPFIPKLAHDLDMKLWGYKTKSGELNEPPKSEDTHD